jgi:AAA domain
MRQQNETSTSSTFKFPVPRKKVIVETELMREMESRVLAIHELCGLCAWYGSSGAGKSTTAEWMTKRINEAFDPDDEHSFKAVAYEVGKIKSGWGNEAKRAIRSLYSAIAGVTIDEGFYGRSTAEELADMVVYTAQKEQIQIAFVDEAGLLSLDAIGGLVLVSDKAKQIGFNLTIVLIGMDDLPQKLDPKRRPQIYRRIHDWCYFRHYELEQTIALLKALHPHFASLDQTQRSDWEQFKFVHEISNGLPGFIAQFISRFDAQYKISPEDIDTTFLRAVHLRTVYDMQDMFAQSKKNGGSINVASEPKVNSNESSKKKKTAKAK